LDVAFLANGTQLGDRTNFPYALSWTNPAVGNYTLQATVADPHGGNGHFRAVNIVILTNFPPTVSILTPVDGQGYFAPVSIPITAQASDDGFVTNVSFFQGPNKIGQSTNSPFSWSGAVCKRAITC
jgi:hypothetical protein